MTDRMKETLNSLTPIQCDAVNWINGSALVLAGPGAGKTRVLTTRIAKLLEESPNKKFKVLALTFTTKAAAEMLQRVEQLVPEAAEERTFIGTFHGFCAEILGQHGSHIGIQPDFGICDQPGDRRGLLTDAIHEAVNEGEQMYDEDIRWLDTIDRMKARVISPEKAASQNNNPRMVRAYELYEAKLRSENLMDFNGLILDACRLLAEKPAVAKRIRDTYPYWLLDEFQDTSPAQYWLLHYLSGGEFRNIFAVADEDQIIYQWAGASYSQIEKFREKYKPVLIQLVENHRCPPEIVQIANRLVAHNTQRIPEKKLTLAARKLPTDAMSLRTFETDIEEQEFLASELLLNGPECWGKSAILGRTRALLEPTLSYLKNKGIRAVILQRRDNFISPQFVWLQTCLDQVLRPLDKRAYVKFVNSANSIADIELDPILLISEAEASGIGFLEHWAKEAQKTDSKVAQLLGNFVINIVCSRQDWEEVVKKAIPVLQESSPVFEDAVSDFAEDYTAWINCIKEIRLGKGGHLELSDIVQGLALRSKEPPRDPDAVALLTIHASKGLEFDNVYVIGLAEQEMPSWQSLKKGDTSSEMEEERRNCFVAITRTKERLTLSWAKNYRGYKRLPSRFLSEMGLLSE